MCIDRTPNLRACGWKEQRMRPQVLVIRVVLGLVFGALLSRVFFPTKGMGLIFIIAGLLVFFAYVFEYVHKRGDS